MPGNVQQDIYDGFIRASVDLERLTESTRGDVVGLLEQAKDEITGLLAKNDLGEIKLTKWRESRLEMLKGEISGILGETYKVTKDHVYKELRDIAGYDAVKVADIINTPFGGATLFDVTLTNDMLNEVVNSTMIEGRVIGDWWKKKSDDYRDQMFATLHDVNRRIQLGLIEGQAIGEMVRRIVGTKAEPGTLGIMKRDATALVRTSVLQVANNVRKDLYEANSDVIKGYRQVSTLDARTTPLCRALDNGKWDMNGKPLEGTTMGWPGFPPHHWQCRSVMIPILKSYRELEKYKPEPGRVRAHNKKLKALDLISPEVRASMAGPVAADLDYGAWLKTQTEAFQIDALGVKRWKLWKANKLTMADLIDQQGRQLKVADLIQKMKDEGRQVRGLTPEERPPMPKPVPKPKFLPENTSGIQSVSGRSIPPAPPPKPKIVIPKEQAARQVIKQVAKGDYHYDGGDCGMFARSIYEALGGEKAGVEAFGLYFRSEDDIGHIILKYKGKYIDGYGIQTYDEIIGRWIEGRPIGDIELRPLILGKIRGGGDRAWNWFDEGKAIEDARLHKDIEKMLKEVRETKVKLFDYPEAINPHGALNTLLNGELVKMEKMEMGGGINDSYIVEFKTGNKVIKGIYKPMAGERWDVRMTVNNRDVPLAYREAMAYEVDQALGLGLVPPTAVTHIDGKVGSIQMWEDLCKPGYFYSGDNPKVEERVFGLTFDYIIGNTDRHGKNWLRRTTNGKLIFIDHGYSFPRATSTRTTGLDEFRHTLKDDYSIKEIEASVQFIKTSPKMKAFLDRLKKWDVEAFASRWGLNEKETSALRERVFRILDIRKSDRASKLFWGFNQRDF